LAILHRQPWIRANVKSHSPAVPDEADRRLGTTWMPAAGTRYVSARQDELKIGHGCRTEARKLAFDPETFFKLGFIAARRWSTRPPARKSHRVHPLHGRYLDPWEHQLGALPPQARSGLSQFLKSIWPPDWSDNVPQQPQAAPGVNADADSQPAKFSGAFDVNCNTSISPVK
jgi:hypothetical protein